MFGAKPLPASPHFKGCPNRLLTPHIAGVSVESQGLVTHGFSCVAQYSTHLRSGRVNGAAVPRVLQRRGGALLVDADEGLAVAACDLAVTACDLAVTEAIAAALQQGVAIAGVVRSHHCGVVVDPLRAVAAAGMVGRVSPIRRRPCRRRAASPRSSAPTRWRRCLRAAVPTR